MAAIGGIFNVSGGSCDTAALVRMSKATLSRGGKHGQREAAVLGDTGLFWISEAEKNVSARRDEIITVCDGEIYTESEMGIGAERLRAFDESDAETCLEAYLKYGIDIGEHISGDLALCVYDRRKKELFLIRTGNGMPPLYYGIKDSSIGFASELGGMLAFFDSPAEVSRSTLRAHVLSRGGQYNGTDLYRDIYSVEQMSGCLCSRLGITPFKYVSFPSTPSTEQRIEAFGGELVCPDEEGMSRLLRETLYAFGYPQFDCLMPSFLRDVKISEETGRAIFDGTLCCDIGYSLERRYALCSIGGYRPVCLPPPVCTVKEKELKKMESIMLSLFSERDKQQTAFVLGDDIENELLRERNTALRIRYLGMALQSVIWYDTMRITLI